MVEKTQDVDSRFLQLLSNLEHPYSTSKETPSKVLCMIFDSDEPVPLMQDITL
jgi:hypothetical protein